VPKKNATIAAALSFDLFLHEDVVLRNGALLRGWQLLQGPHGPIRWEDLLNLVPPVSLVFETDPGLVAVNSRPWMLTQREQAEAEVSAKRAQLVAQQTPDSIDVEWPPVEGLRVRQRAVHGIEDVSGAVGTVSGAHQKVENGRGIKQPGWVVVRWDAGGADILHVTSLQLADDTHDFLRRVYSHRVHNNFGKQTSHASIRNSCAEIQQSKVLNRAHWHYVVIYGVSCKNGSFMVWDPAGTTTQEITTAGTTTQEFTMPVQVLKSCVESGGKVPAALLVRCIQYNPYVVTEPGMTAADVPSWDRPMPIMGELRVGDTVLVDAEALADAGFRVDNLSVIPWPHRQSHRRLLPVPAVIVALSGRRQVDVEVKGYSGVYAVRGSRVMSADPRDGVRSAEGVDCAPLCFRPCFAPKRLPCGLRGRPASAGRVNSRYN